MTLETCTAAAGGYTCVRAPGHGVIHIDPRQLTSPRVHGHGWTSIPQGAAGYVLLTDDMLSTPPQWFPGTWYRVTQPDGSLWMETSDREQAVAEARSKGYPLLRQWYANGNRWQPEEIERMAG